MCFDCEWEETLEDIRSMRDNTLYEFADDTLSGIEGWIEENNHVTEKQKSAVSNIRDSV